ncbi:MAG: hypothetical protein ABI721_05615 [Candidatus Dojkabacteria bacterium]
MQSRTFLPSHTNKSDITYTILDRDDFYIFNYPRDDNGVFYLEPILVEVIKSNEGIDLERLKGKVIVLPENTPLVSDRAGLKCRINFITL